MSSGLDYVPGVSTVKAGFQFVIGRDILTLERVSRVEQALNLIPWQKAAKVVRKAGSGVLSQVTDVLGGKKIIVSPPIITVSEHATGFVTTKIPRTAESAGANGPRLLATEGNVGTYRDLIRAGTKGDNITPNHIPSANRMAREGVSKGDGISINMEQPVPGVGGRHRATFTYGTAADINMTPRDALAAGVWDARRIYMNDGLYTPQIRSNLQQLIQMNKTRHPTIFVKPGQ